MLSKSNELVTVGASPITDHLSTFLEPESHLSNSSFDSYLFGCTLSDFREMAQTILVPRVYMVEHTSHCTFAKQ